MQSFHKSTQIEVPASELEVWHHRPGAFQRLTPPWENVRVIEEPDEIADGTRAIIEMKAGPVTTRWIAEHSDCISGKGFTDIQIDGPFAHWKHVHRFPAINQNQSTLRDSIEYKLPVGALGNIFGRGFVRRKLQRTFSYRHAVTKMDLERRATEPTTPGDAPMTVLITGASGMIGSALESYLRMRGHSIRRVTRSPSRRDDIRWDPDNDTFDLPRDAKIGAVVHLAGENIAGGRWTEARKKRILESRRKGTRLLVRKLADLKNPPAVLVSASGVNYYQTGTSTAVDESAPRGSGFLSDVCEAWESSTTAAEAAGIRVIHLRLGVVISPAGGALGKMLPAFQLGVAGRLGTGQQRMAWIARDDVIDIVHRALVDTRYQGAINAVAPQIPTNSEFTQTLARTLNRPAIVPVPASALKLALGEQMANETLLVDLAVVPDKLEKLGYPFRFPQLSTAFAAMLGRI